ncbi:bifunctional TVP38/TMEM64 family protein/FAD-dependent oxidoreductase [Aquabacterium sp.]|uniref:FAD-dependent oxidoreductase n=1 Tax=Aquabacterium TaxID=92793 RepID=UPI001D4E4527|nr:bifunctional TVP38/TMEM64 family protein/FAD-dependent oxidoreductase [Aquabacterium sp.]MBT9610147.1 FAD-dependent oxidoreductase [Aquabacterium sp.]
MKRAALVLGIVALVVGFFALGLDQRLSFEGIQASLADVQAWQARAPGATAAAFVGVYVLAAALSLPGATLLTLLGGAVFGLLWGTLLVSVASSVGALLAFLVSRYLLRDVVSQRFGDRLKTIHDGIEREGAFYLFTLRMVPVFPFFLVNLLMGLTPMKARTFYGVSQVGMLAGTVVYVNAGTQLAQLSSLSGILSPAVLWSSALLGVFPLVAKGLVTGWERRRVYQRWTRPARFDRNLIVIGGGAAGLVSAYIAAAVKAKVTLVEAHKMGGDCLNYGCVPSKALIKSAKLAHQMRHADRYGLQAQPSVPFSFRVVMARVHEVIRTVAPHDSVERYTALGVDVRLGRARIVDPWTVEITAHDGSVQRLTTRSIVIAAGAQPLVPPLPGIDEVGCLTSDTLWDALAQMDEPPRRVVVLGGGPIGAELAQALARLGSQVSQVEMGPRILAREDEDVSALARQSLQADGVQVLTEHQAVRCERALEGGIETRCLVLEHQGDTRRLPFDVLVCAVGRSARLTGYGLEELGIPTNRTVVTNAYLETLYPNIFAAGDVAGPYQFTHTAAHQAWHASVNALFGAFKKFKVDHRVIPWATFIDPEVARVGLNEMEAREKGIAVEVTRFGIDDLDRAIADSAAHGFVKVLTVPGKDRILGVTIVGEHAGDLLAEFVLAMKWGLGLNKILSTIHTYPTLAEANKYVAGEWKRAHAPAWALPWLARFHQWRLG